MGRKQINGEAAPLRLAPGTLAKIDALLRPGEPRAAFLRAAVECEVERRAIPHHQLTPGDILRWQCSAYPANIHRWRVRSICLGGTGQESLIEMESLTHAPGSGAEFPFALPIVIVPEVLVRNLVIEDVGEQFGLVSPRRSAP